MQFLDKFAPRRRAQRRGSTAGLLQPEDGIAANSKARQYNKRVAPRVSNMLTKSLSTSLVTEGMSMSLPAAGRETSTKRASDGGATLAPPKRMSSFTRAMVRGTSTRIGLQRQPDLTRWSSSVEDDFDASGNFSIEGEDFQGNEENGTDMKRGASFEIPETTQAREASFAPQFDPESTGFDSSLGPDTFANFGLSFEIPEASTSTTEERRRSTPQAREASFAPPQFDPQSTGFDSSLGPETFAKFGSSVPLEYTTAKTPSSPLLAFESSKEGALFADFDSNGADISGARKATSEEEQVTASDFEAPQQQSFANLLKKSSAAGSTFASYEHSATQLFSYSEGPESFVQFDPNSSKPQVFYVGNE